MGSKVSRQEFIAQTLRDFHDHNLTELETLNQTLFAAIEALEEAQIPYALIGGVAVKRLGRPRITHDIDLFICPDDANKILEVLEAKGFHTERRDLFWLYKAWRAEVLVDIIFKSSGDIYFDEEIRAHVRRVPYNGRYLNAISPEDFIVIKASAHQEDNPHHWHDALAVLTQGNLDWDYLLKRARHSPRRVLSLLIYGQSNDIAVPSEVIKKLYRSLYEPPTYIPEPVVNPYRLEDGQQAANQHNGGKESPIYIKGRIIEALTSDERIAEHDIKVIVSENSIVARGEVFTEEQKEAVNEVIEDIAPSFDIRNQIGVRILTPPEGSEAIR
jgi:predicted nucleotidyltransferase